jgi:hypothetical protein
VREAGKDVLLDTALIPWLGLEIKEPVLTARIQWYGVPERPTKDIHITIAALPANNTRRRLSAQVWLYD